jgi:hypothetical protein
MTIEIKLNGNDYAIGVDGNCFTAIRYGVNDTDGSKNFGERTSKELGYFNKLSNAALRLCREEIASSDDVITLKEFASRVEAINKQLLEQLENIPV